MENVEPSAAANDQAGAPRSAASYRLKKAPLENEVVSTYKKIENAAVGAYKKIENRFIEKFLEPIGERNGRDAAEQDDKAPRPERSEL